LLRDALADVLPYPPDRVGDELDTLVGVVLIRSANEPFAAECDKLVLVQAVSSIPADIRSDEAQVRRNESVACCAVAVTGTASEVALFIAVEWFRVC
jgi:hypothetical protein